MAKIVGSAAAFAKIWWQLRRKKSGISSDTELIEYALAEVALEDDFGMRLIRRKGQVAKDVDLEF